MNSWRAMIYFPPRKHGACFLIDEISTRRRCRTSSGSQILDESDEDLGHNAFAQPRSKSPVDIDFLAHSTSASAENTRCRIDT